MWFNLVFRVEKNEFCILRTVSVSFSEILFWYSCSYIPSRITAHTHALSLQKNEKEDKKKSTKKAPRKLIFQKLKGYCDKFAGKRRTCTFSIQNSPANINRIWNSPARLDQSTIGPPPMDNESTTTSECNPGTRGKGQWWWGDDDRRKR